MEYRGGVIPPGCRHTHSCTHKLQIAVTSTQKPHHRPQNRKHTFACAHIQPGVERWIKRTHARIQAQDVFLKNNTHTCRTHKHEIPTINHI